MVTAVKKNDRAISWRIDDVENPPPEFTMLINMNNLDIQYTQLKNETRTLGGFYEELWGEQLTALSASGTTAMFFGEGGLTNEFARDTEGYKNFIRLLNLYKNNGKEYIKASDPPTLASKANPSRIVGFGKVVMTFINKQYQGYFESFDFTEHAFKPFNFEYSLSFKVIRIIGDLIVQEGNFITDTDG